MYLFIDRGHTIRPPAVAGTAAAAGTVAVAAAGMVAVAVAGMVGAVATPGGYCCCWAHSSAGDYWFSSSASAYLKTAHPLYVASFHFQT